MLKDVSPFSEYVDTTFLLIVGISSLVLVGLVITMVYFVVKYSRKKNPHPTNIKENTWLEVTWTAVPLVLFIGMFYLGWKGYIKEIRIPADAISIKVTGRMWAWQFEYPNGVTADTLYVPVSKPIKLTLHSLDVNHSLYIPAFRIKKDVIPNRENVMWFSTPREASYDIACAEYCGLNHAYMYTKLVAMDSTRFESWYRQVSGKQKLEYRSVFKTGKTE